METADTAALLLLNLPQGALAGIDLLAFTTTPRFQGVKNLPRGIHFTFVGSSTAFSERHGLWFYVDEPELNSLLDFLPLHIAKWDPASDCLAAVTDKADILRQRANLGSIWREGLTPYRQSSSADSSERVEEDPVDWENLTSCVTPALLDRILTSSDHPSNNTSWTLSSGSSARQDLETIPGLDPNTDLNSATSKPLVFLPINLKQTWDPSATGRARTEAAQDRSWALNNLITQSCADDEDAVLGELQFAFVMVLTLNNFSCFEQWKRLLSLLLTCRSVVAARARLFVRTLRLLRLQLQHCKVADTGLIDMSDEGGSLLRNLLGRFRKGVEALKGDVGVQDVVDELEELEEYLHAEHGWQFGGSFAKGGVLELEDGEEVRVDMGSLDDEDDETGEYAPQIVDLTPEQARLLNVGGTEGLDVRLDRAKLQEDEENAGDDVNIIEQTTGREILKSSQGESDEEEMQDLEEMDARF